MQASLEAPVPEPALAALEDSPVFHSLPGSRKEEDGAEAAPHQDQHLVSATSETCTLIIVIIQPETN